MRVLRHRECSHMNLSHIWMPLTKVVTDRVPSIHRVIRVTSRALIPLTIVRWLNGDSVRCITSDSDYSDEGRRVSELSRRQLGNAAAQAPRLRGLLPVSLMSPTVVFLDSPAKPQPISRWGNRALDSSVKNSLHEKISCKLFTRSNRSWDENQSLWHKRHWLCLQILQLNWKKKNQRAFQEWDKNP